MEKIMRQAIMRKSDTDKEYRPYQNLRIFENKRLRRTLQSGDDIQKVIYDAGPSQFQSFKGKHRFRR